MVVVERRGFRQSVFMHIPFLSIANEVFRPLITTVYSVQMIRIWLYAQILLPTAVHIQLYLGESFTVNVTFLLVLLLFHFFHSLLSFWKETKRCTIKTAHTHTHTSTFKAKIKCREKLTCSRIFFCLLSYPCEIYIMHTLHIKYTQMAFIPHCRYCILLSRMIWFFFFEKRTATVLLHGRFMFRCRVLK